VVVCTSIFHLTMCLKRIPFLCTPSRESESVYTSDHCVTLVVKPLALIPEIESEWRFERAPRGIRAHDTFIAHRNSLEWRKT
jgi:hypothetical protein